MTPDPNSPARGSTRPSITEAIRITDSATATLTIQEEILAVTEDFAHYIARRGRGITVATPDRRALQKKLEAVVLSFVQHAAEPEALDARVPARLEEILRQSEENS